MLLVALGAGYGLVSGPAMGLARIDVQGNHWVSSDEVRRVLALAPGTNLVALSTDDLVARLRSLPAVADARVGVELPDRLRVEIVERQAILAWEVGGETFAVDPDGLLFASLPDGPAVPGDGVGSSAASSDAGPSSAAPTDLPVVVDQRERSRLLTVGGRLDPVDLDVAARLASLRPADVGSTAPRLRLLVDDADGFVLAPDPPGWVAVFGFYGATVRPPDLIPGQVRLLRSLLLGREARIGRVVLASATEGTYLPRTATPSPSPAPRSP